MGTTLEHGVYLPDEGERNCYAGLKVNWETLDQKVADISALQSAIAGALHREIVATLPTTDIDPNTIYMILSGTSATENVYNEFMYVNNAWELIGTSATDLTNYYTKAEVDGKLLLKASASDLTSHTGDTDIHVTTADKNKWNNGVTQAYVLRYSSTAITDNSTIAYSTLDNTDNIKATDKVIDSDGKIFSIVSVDSANQTVTVGTALIDLALDANVMHLSGDENVNGTKTFKDMIPIDGDYLGNEASTNQRTNICLRSNRDTADKSCAYISRFRQNKPQGALQTGDLQMIGFDVLENEVRTNNVFSIQCSGWVDNVPTKVKLLSTSSDSTFGSSNRPSKINDLNPGSLSLPDLNNGIDISGYITIGNTDNNYTPSVDGWIWIRLIGNGASISQGDFGINANYVTDNLTQEKWVETNLFVTKNVQATIRCRSITGIVSVKFYPCLGNV